MAGKAIGRAASSKFLSERLLAVLKREIALVEEASKDYKPRTLRANSSPAECGSGDSDGAALASSGRAAGKATGGAKERIEAIGQLTRTLEKLLELKRLELLALQGGETADDAETAKLRTEMMKRLRALDARRRTGPALFGPEGGADAASGPPHAGQGFG